MMNSSAFVKYSSVMKSSPCNSQVCQSRCNNWHDRICWGTTAPASNNTLPNTPLTTYALPQQPPAAGHGNACPVLRHC